MRLKKIMWILGLTAALTFVGGCSGNTAEGDQQTQESEEGQEVMDTVPDEGAEAEPEAGADTSPDESAGQEGTVSEAPVRIYGTIQEVGEDTITVDNQSGNSYEGEIILTIDPESTLIVDGQTGLPLTLADIEGGSFEAYLGSIMTMSIPPQTVPYVVIANVPEDSGAPLYVVAAADAVLEDGVYTLEGTDGSTWEIPEDVDIQPFRTKNIVTVGDITEGRGCLIWQDTLARLHEHSRKQIRLRVMNSRAAFGYLTSRKVACKMDGDSILFRDMPDEDLAALIEKHSRNQRRQYTYYNPEFSSHPLFLLTRLLRRIIRDLFHKTKVHTIL